MNALRFPVKRTELCDFELPPPPPEPAEIRRPGAAMTLPVVLVVSAAILGASAVSITLIVAKNSHAPAETTRVCADRRDGCPRASSGAPPAVSRDPIFRSRTSEPKTRRPGTGSGRRRRDR